MRVIQGSKLLEITPTDLSDIVASYGNVHIDFGTGDGRFVYKKALESPKTLYVGIDPSQRQLEVYSKKAAKDKLTNTLFVLGSVELFPTELFGYADLVSILLPWGTLLQAIVLAKKTEISNLCNLLAKGGSLEIVFGYSQDAEPSEVKRLGLDHLTMDSIRESIVPAFMEEGFASVNYNTLTREQLKQFETTWAKKLSFGNDRPLYHLQFSQKIKES